MSDHPEHRPPCPGHVTAPQIRWRGWRPWMWIAMWAVALVGAAVVAGLTILISFSGVSVCDAPPDPDLVADAQRGLAILAGVAFAPWLLAAAWARPRLRVLIAGAVCAAPACLGWLDGVLRPDTYSITWCF